MGVARGAITHFCELKPRFYYIWVMTGESETLICAGRKAQMVGALAPVITYIYQFLNAATVDGEPLGNEDSGTELLHFAVVVILEAL